MGRCGLRKMKDSMLDTWPDLDRARRFTLSWACQVGEWTFIALAGRYSS